VLHVGNERSKKSNQIHHSTNCSHTLLETVVVNVEGLITLSTLMVLSESVRKELDIVTLVVIESTVPRFCDSRCNASLYSANGRGI
jgi:hypothetical protein